MAKIILSVILLVAFAYVNYSFIYMPRNNRIVDLDLRISNLQNKIAEGRRIAARLDSLKVEYADLIERRKFMEILLPEEKDVPAFLVMLQETLDEFNIDLTNFLPQNILQEKDSIIAQLPIVLNFTANYFETIRFLDRLENFPRIVEVRDLKLAPVGDDLENVNVDLNMVTYVLMKGN